ncbi:MAG: L-aspartate oxidase [Bacteroidales bacterium]|nr:L-aspartate oxidase [Bacteroidales bacterium]MBR6919851.1 L-aspartate oxidase [Bacteroidales bacterium]
MMKEVDFLVIGSGIAGLSFALKVADYGKVCVLTKADAAEGSTRYAQGGIAAVIYDTDSFEKHIQDTLVAGAGICDEETVRMTITEAPERIKELIRYGIRFDKRPDGLYDLHREGGHSNFRILHHKDNTGAEVERGLLEEIHNHPNIELIENQYTVEIITQHHLGQWVTHHTPDIECYGAYVLDSRTKKVETYLAKVTLLATGGSGNVYTTTTNPLTATGDGVAMVHRARGKVADMEFVQFHPTSLYHPGEKPAFLITEALRGAGAILKTIKGEEFMQKYDSRLSLAPRDIVARAIDNEMKISGAEYLYLDARHLGKRALMEGFPNIFAKCLDLGINISNDMIPIRPAAHYQCGGILVDRNGESSIRHLYAAGECSRTGLHGGNRLASNSLLEAIVYAHNAAMDAIRKIKDISICHEVPDWNAEGLVFNEEMVLVTQTRKELQELMSNYVGIVRSDLRLKRAYDRLSLIYKETEDLYKRSVLTEELSELRNLIACAYLIIRAASQRKESIGLHYSVNYPPVEKQIN